MRLSNLTWPKAEEYFRAHDTVLIGIGSIECHGRHMPLGTDTLIPDFLLDKIEQKSDVLICPTIPYGATESLCDYPGTINLGTELLYQVLGRVCDSLFQHGARRFVILNGHGGNIKSIDRVGYDIQRKGGILAYHGKSVPQQHFITVTRLVFQVCIFCQEIIKAAHDSLKLSFIDTQIGAQLLTACRQRGTFGLRGRAVQTVTLLFQNPAGGSLPRHLLQIGRAHV